MTEKIEQASAGVTSVLNAELGIFSEEFMSKAQFGLGHHKGKQAGFETATDVFNDANGQQQLAEIYWVCGELASRIGNSDDDPSEDVSLARAITMLLAYHSRLEKEHKQRQSITE